MEIESVKNQTIREVDSEMRCTNSKEVANEIDKRFTRRTICRNVTEIIKINYWKRSRVGRNQSTCNSKDGTLMALDGKVMTDDNSNFRHDELQQYQETALKEQRRVDFHLSN